ncbi:TetR/AcrR family transcriptional regulator [Marinobacter koreensis]|uniref:TetR/AcrR family transcriptional regulator n=1 Tax=Marinobacter koreensis TaxID=335974 RepID=A0ABW0RJS5_9GAMM|nr:TetR/AcrR family transcriptional regulator [Marinobacter koreensis]MCK7547292.1 TetR/AcrR family transcriptional regulator [Marinobacter koreensis]MDX1817387.1 TetR/AcrR family transcriptional regulator [Marinobacter sp.]
MDKLQDETAAIGRRERNRIRNRNAILMSARDTFRELGYDRATIRDIVQRSGLATGTFYNYFTSKQDIFATLLTDFLTRLNDGLIRNRRSAHTTEDFIHRAYLGLYQATARDPLVYELARQNDRALRKLFGSNLLELAMSSLEEDVRDAMERNLLPSVDYEYLCASFFGVAYEMSLSVARRAHNAPESAEQEAEGAARFSTVLFLGGLPELAKLS